MCTLNEKIEKDRKILINKFNKIKFPIFYSYSICVHYEGAGEIIIFNESKWHNTKYYSVYPFYKSIMNINE